MSLRAFLGGAGCGKTHRLMEILVEELAANPLAPGRKVLALTFMHGSRRRLDERLSAIRELGSHYECSTLDSFAGRIVRRWRSLAEGLGYAIPNATEYDATCTVAGAVLDNPIAAKWVAAAYPIILLDEAQDLKPARLGIIRALEPHATLLVAADEFQCLTQELRPNPTCEWIDTCPGVETLAVPRRTTVTALLEAATALRRGEPPVSNRVFSIRPAANSALAAANASNEIQWYRKGGSVAIISPTSSQYVKGALEWLEIRTTTRGCGPHRVMRELSEDDEVGYFISRLILENRVQLSAAIAAVEACNVPYVTHAVSRALDVLRRARGRDEFEKQEIEDLVRGALSSKRARQSGNSGIRAMTVHGAKNREFDLIIVFWPANVLGDADQKRRLLYNAITRARRRCMVLVQAQRQMNQPPFS